MFDDVIELASGGWGLGLAVVVGGGLLLAKGGRPLIKKAIQWRFEPRSTRSRAPRPVWSSKPKDLYEESKAEVGIGAGRGVTCAPPGQRPNRVAKCDLPQRWLRVPQRRGARPAASGCRRAAASARATGRGHQAARWRCPVFGTLAPTS